jgi:hypothetical protein
MKKGGSGGLPRDITGDALTWRGPNVSYRLVARIRFYSKKNISPSSLDRQFRSNLKQDPTVVIALCGSVLRMLGFQ